MPTSFPSKKAIDSRTVGFLTAIVLLGAFLRFYKLSFQSFWLDEYYNISIALDNIHGFLGFDLLPPAYFLILETWLKFFPVISEFSTRLPSVIIGSFSIIVFYLLAHELFERKTALWATFFLSINALHIDYCQEVKYYPLMLLMCMMMQLEYVKMLKMGRREDYFWYTLFSAIGLYSYYYLALLLFIQLVHGLIYARQNRAFIKRLLFSQAMAAALIMPMVIHAIYALQTPKLLTHTVAWINAPTFSSVLDTTIAMFAGQNWHFAKLPHLNASWLHTVYYIFLTALCIFFVVTLQSKKDHHTGLTITLFWLFLPTIIIFIFSKTVLPLYQLRYLLFSLPAFCLILGWLVSQGQLQKEKAAHAAPNKIRNSLGWAGILLFYLFVSATSLIYYFNHPTRAQFREAARFIAEKSKKGETVAVKGYYYEHALFNYYFRQAGGDNMVGYSERSQDFDPRPFDWILSVNKANVKTSRDLYAVKNFCQIKVWHKK